MEFSSAFVPRSEFRDMRKGLNSQHSHSEVIIIDRSPTGAAHQVYQLKTEHINFYNNLLQTRQEFQRLDRDAFIVLGNLLEIEMSKKMVLLTTGNVVSYKYLILFNGNEQPIELETALHTLMDALLIDAIKVKDRLNAAPSPYMSYPKETAVHSYKVPQETNSVNAIAKPCIQQHEDNLSIDLGATARSLCQVQL